MTVTVTSVIHLDDATPAVGGRACSRREPFTQHMLVYFLANVNSRSLYVIANLSVVSLSSVTFVHPTRAIEIFGNISTLLGTLATH